MSIRNLHILIIVCVVYVVAQMLADITHLRNIVFAGIGVSAFSIVYPLTFTLRDMAHKLAGANVARTLIITSAGPSIWSRNSSSGSYPACRPR